MRIQLTVQKIYVVTASLTLRIQGIVNTFPEIWTHFLDTFSEIRSQQMCIDNLAIVDSVGSKKKKKGIARCCRIDNRKLFFN